MCRRAKCLSSYFNQLRMCELIDMHGNVKNIARRFLANQIIGVQENFKIIARRFLANQMIGVQIAAAIFYPVSRKLLVPGFSEMGGGGLIVINGLCLCEQNF